MLKYISQYSKRLLFEPTHWLNHLPSHGWVEWQVDLFDPKYLSKIDKLNTTNWIWNYGPSIQSIKVGNIIELIAKCSLLMLNIWRARCPVTQFRVGSLEQCAIWLWKENMKPKKWEERIDQMPQKNLFGLDWENLRFLKFLQFNFCRYVSELYEKYLKLSNLNFWNVEL